MTERVELRLMSEVDGKYVHFQLTVDGVVVARSDPEGGFVVVEQDAVPAELRELVREVLWEYSARVAGALEGLVMARGAFAKRLPPAASMKVEVPELRPTQAAAAA